MSRKTGAVDEIAWPAPWGKSAPDARFLQQILTKRQRAVECARGTRGLPTPTGVDTSTVVKGLFYGGGMTQLISQMIGSGAVVFSTLAVSAVLMYAVKATGTLRVSAEGEIEGLDIHEHGMPAYPEYVIHGFEPGLSAAAKAQLEAIPLRQPKPISAQ